MRAFSTYKKANIPIIDFAPYLNKTVPTSHFAGKFFDSLQENRCVFVRDPRFDPQDNIRFRREITKYFRHRMNLLTAGTMPEEVLRSQGDIGGLSPRGIEASPNFHDERKDLLEHQKPKSDGSVLEDVLRYRHPIGDIAKLKIPPKGKQRFPDHIEKLVFLGKPVPKDFPHISDLMENFGNTLLRTISSCATLCEEALQWEKGFLTDKLDNGASLTSPGALDLENMKVGDVICSFHKDYILLTGHAAPNFSGFLTWTDTNEKYEVEFPEDCIFIQTGYMLEILTGGLLKAGFHEVEYTDIVAKQVEAAKERGDSLLRINSTVFADISPYDTLIPHHSLRTEEVVKKYPEISAVDYTLDYYKALGLINDSVAK